MSTTFSFYPASGKTWQDIPDNPIKREEWSWSAAGTWEADSEEYNVLQARLAAGKTTRYWDNAAKAAWLFDGNNFWTYDDPQTFCCKTAYIRHNQLRGVMFWELSDDTADGELISAIDLGLRRPGQGWGYGHCK